MGTRSRHGLRAFFCAVGTSIRFGCMLSSARSFNGLVAAQGWPRTWCCGECSLAHRPVEMDLHDIMAKRAHRTPRTGERNGIVRRHLEMARRPTPDSSRMPPTPAISEIWSNSDGRLKMTSAVCTILIGGNHEARTTDQSSDQKTG
jgi:hypothetical protein